MKVFWKILQIYLIWRVALFVIAFLGTHAIVAFGGRFPYYRELEATHLPSWIWGFGNFDGVYYLRIAKGGYQDEFTQAFFPIFPLLVKYLTYEGLYFITALVLSNLFLIAALFMLYKLFNLDFKKEINFKSLILLLSFPTAFYFGAVYSESLFLFLTATSLYLARKQKFLYSGVFAAVASATKIFGVMLSVVLVMELYRSVKLGELKIKSFEFIKSLVGILIAPIGLFYYMLYLKLNYNNALYFLNSQHAFGAERSNEPFILLPQVFYRYLKILTSVPVNSPQYFNASLELLLTIFAFIGLIYFFKRMRASYTVFTLGCLLIPTLTGTLSSMPRYVLTSFLLIPFLVERFPHYFKLFLAISIIFSGILICLFTRGYWVA